MRQFVKFWGSPEGFQLERDILEACVPKNNKELGQEILHLAYKQDLADKEAVSKFLLNCQKSIQRMLATI